MIFSLEINGKPTEIQVARKAIKTVRLKVFPSKEIRLSVPHDTPEEWICDFLNNKKNWIENKATLFEQKKAIEKEEHIRSGSSTRILGRQLTIQVSQAT